VKTYTSGNFVIDPDLFGGPDKLTDDEEGKTTEEDDEFDVFDDGPAN
jgi:hypothetical protein